MTPPATPDCRAFPALLDDYLDGSRGLRSVLLAHTATCAGCAAEMRLAEMILNAVACPTPEVADPALVARILAAVNADRGRRAPEPARRTWKVVAGSVGSLAACVAVWLAVRPPVAVVAPAGPFVEVAKVDPVPFRVEPIGDRLNEASDLLVKLTRRRTAETVTAAKSLVATAEMSLDPLPNEMPAATELQTAARSVKSVGRNALMCFEPLTRSAGNALSYLRQEVLPTADPH